MGHQIRQLVRGQHQVILLGLLSGRGMDKLDFHIARLVGPLNGGVIRHGIHHLKTVAQGVHVGKGYRFAAVDCFPFTHDRNSH